jgi:hypothetical protein
VEPNEDKRKHQFLAYKAGVYWYIQVPQSAGAEFNEIDQMD